MGWTEERVELLKKLWADGLSASQIAGRLGEVTRNAVIGKVHRLGLAAAPRHRVCARRVRATASRQFREVDGGMIGPVGHTDRKQTPWAGLSFG
jgi:GcrA cell cycle regulator